MKLKHTMIFFLSLLLFACSNEIEPKEHLGEIYIVALDTIMELDEALSHDIEYIAIDSERFKDVDDNEKEEILNYFRKKYDVEIIYANLEQLQDLGRYNPDTLVLDGVLLKIENVNIKLNNSVLFEGFKYRAGDGAIGVEAEIEYKDNKWQTTDITIPWIS